MNSLAIPPHVFLLSFKILSKQGEEALIPKPTSLSEYCLYSTGFYLSSSLFLWRSWWWI